MHNDSVDMGKGIKQVPVRLEKRVVLSVNKVWYGSSWAHQMSLFRWFRHLYAQNGRDLLRNFNILH